MATLSVPFLSEYALMSGEIARIVFEPPNEGFAERDNLFEAISRQYPDLHVEQNADGEVVLMAPEGNESSFRNADIAMQLRVWSRADGRGLSVGPSTSFFLPDGSKLGPDAAWISTAKLRQFPLKERRHFLRLAPEFVIELKSPTDSWARLQEKMLVWLKNGVELGWLIDADKRIVLVYTQQTMQEPTVLAEPAYVLGSDSVAGFRLELGDIWKGMDF